MTSELEIDDLVYFDTGKEYILSHYLKSKDPNIPQFLYYIGTRPKEDKKTIEKYKKGEIKNGLFYFNGKEPLYTLKDGKRAKLSLKNGELKVSTQGKPTDKDKLINDSLIDYINFKQENPSKDQETDNTKKSTDKSKTPDVNLNGKHYTYVPDKEAYFYVDDNVDGLLKVKPNKIGRIQVNSMIRKFVTPLDEKKIKTTETLKQLKNTIESVSSTNLEKKKAKRKYDKKLKEYKFYDNIMNAYIPYIEPPEKQSYIPQKFIPLFLQGPDGSYHKITNEEIEALKNDPTGDYYDGSGNKYILYNPETLEDNYSSDDVKIFDDSIKESKMFIPETLNKYIEDLFENDNPDDIKKYKKVIITINKGSGLFDPLSRLVMQGVDSMKSQWNLLKSFGSMIKRKITGKGCHTGGFNLLGLITPIGDFIYNIKKKVDTALTNKFNAMGCQRQFLEVCQKQSENKQGKGSNIPPYKATGIYYNQQILPKDSSINYKMSIESLRARPSAPGMPGW